MQLVLFNQYITLITKKCGKVNGGDFNLQVECRRSQEANQCFHRQKLKKAG